MRRSMFGGWRKEAGFYVYRSEHWGNVELDGLARSETMTSKFEGLLDEPRGRSSVGEKNRICLRNDNDGHQGHIHSP